MTHQLRGLLAAFLALHTSGCAAIRVARLEHHGASTPMRGAGDAPAWNQHAERRSYSIEHEVPASPEQVYPVLCPVREYDWLEGWTCQMAYSESGVAEPGCVFQTEVALGETWVLTRYDPPERIEYTVFAGNLVMLLRVDVEATDSGSTVSWNRSYTSLDKLGRTYLQRMTRERVEGEMREVAGQLEGFFGG